MPRFSSALDMTQLGNPAAPSAGDSLLYFKSDGVLYSKSSAGIVTAISSYVGGAVANPVDAPDFLISGRSIPRGTMAHSQIIVSTVVNSVSATAVDSGINVTATLVSGRRYTLSCVVIPFTTVAGDVSVVTLRDGSTPTLQTQVVPLPSTSGVLVRPAVVFTAVASAPVAGVSLLAGAHTFRIFIARNSGTGTINFTANSQYPNYLLLEDTGV